jgi:hypothetical protein
VAGVEVRAMERPPITRRELGWGAFFFGAIALLFAVSIVIGVALLAPEVRTFWSKLPR